MSHASEWQRHISFHLPPMHDFSQYLVSPKMRACSQAMKDQALTFPSASFHQPLEHNSSLFAILKQTASLQATSICLQSFQIFHVFTFIASIFFFFFDGDQCWCILTLMQFSMRNKQTLVTNALELGVIYKLHFKLFCHIFVSNEHQH